MTDALEQIRGNGEKVLFIMDDVVNDMKKEARLEKLLCKVLMNRRHVCGAGGSLSVWITTQVYNKVPAPVRKCASHLILYETKNRMELDSLFNEVIVGMTKMESYPEISKRTFVLVATNFSAPVGGEVPLKK